MMGIDFCDVGEPDPVRCSGVEGPVEQVRSDREIVAAVGGPHPAWPRHEGPDTVTAHQSLDTTAAHPAALRLQLDMDTRAAIAPAGIALDPSDGPAEFTLGSRSLPPRA